MRFALSEGMRESSGANVGLRGAASLRSVGRGQLLRDFSALVGRDRANTADMLAYIAEIDRRKLYLEHAYPSMFAFCTKRFRMSEAVAFKRIRAGRAACRFPCILGMVRRGELHLSGVHQLSGHLTEENHRELLRRARYRSMREIEVLIAEVAPKRDAVSMIRALPGRRAEGAGGTTRERAEVCGGATHLRADPRDDAAVPARNSHADARDSGATPTRKPRNLATPLSPGRYKLQVTIGQGARDNLTELQNLLSHQIPDGDLAAVIEQALDVLLTETKKTKAAIVKRPRVRKQDELAGKRRARQQAEVAGKAEVELAEQSEAGIETKAMRTRAVPAQVRREVFERDEGRCAFVDASGRRCGAGWQVEFHHCVPYGRDGPHTVDNVELRCRAHNQFEAELEYGARFMAARRVCGG